MIKINLAFLSMTKVIMTNIKDIQDFANRHIGIPGELNFKIKYSLLS